MKSRQVQCSKILPSIIIIIVLVTMSAVSFAASTTVDAKSNIFGAGHTVPPAPGGVGPGILPPVHHFAKGPNQVLTFSNITGSKSFNGGGSYWGPEGYDPWPTGVSFPSYDGISGIVTNSAQFLTGVFLDDTEPSDPALVSLDFGPDGLTRNFIEVYPGIGQLFFIGNGLTDSDISQRFHVPLNATRLFLGFIDTDEDHLPGLYHDNLGSVTSTFDLFIPPIADAGPDQTVGEGNTVTLVGSNSYDPGGENLSYQWDQISGPSVTLSNPKAANPTFTAPLSVGSGGESLTFQLTVTDEEAAQATDTAIVNVTLPLANRPPNADAGVDQEVEGGETVTLNGSNSFDADGDSLSYQWDQITGPSVTLLPNPAAENPTFTAPFVDSDGQSYTFELTVTDNSGLQATDTTIVNVTSPPGNSPPSAVLGPDQTVDEDTEVTLDGSGSSDPEGGNLFYRWRQVAGRPVTFSDPMAANPTFIAPNVGVAGATLVFKLTVTDEGGLQGVADTLVNVAGDNDFPVADAGDDQTVNENTTVNLDGSGSFDPEGESLSYSWRQVGGTPCNSV